MICKSLFRDIVTARVSTVERYDVFDLFPPNMEVDVDTVYHGHIGDTVRNVPMDREIYHVAKFEKDCSPVEFVENVLSAQLEELRGRLAEIIWEDYSGVGKWLVILRPPQPFRDSVVFGAGMPYRWLVDDAGESENASILHLYIGRRYLGV